MDVSLIFRFFFLLKLAAISKAHSNTMLAEHQTPRNVPRTGLRQLNVKQKCQPIVRNMECSIQLIDFIGVVSIFIGHIRLLDLEIGILARKYRLCFVPLCPLQQTHNRQIVMKSKS